MKKQVQEPTPGSWQVTLLKQGKRGIIFNWNISTMHHRHSIPPFVPQNKHDSITLLRLRLGRLLSVCPEKAQIDL